MLCVQHKNGALLLLPLNTASKLQSLDYGVIKCFKMGYRQWVQRRFIVRIGGCESASELSRNISILDALDWIKHYWKI